MSCNSAKHKKKKIVYINSYHRGHPSSDEIMDVVIERFPEDSFNLQSYFMDTKRNSAQEYIESKSIQLYDSIVSENPDILIVSDDNAVKYLVKPNLNRLSLPVVFCGVNWTDSEYNLPRNQVTGILEILPIEETITTMQDQYPTIKKLLVLSENTTTSRKEAQLMESMFDNLGITVTYKLVNNFNEWKSTFSETEKQYDIIYIPTHGAIKNWNHEEAIRVINQYIKVPVVTCEDFMMPYAVFGMAKVASEQGIWAAETAKKILEGKSPSDFPVTRNQLVTTWLNPSLAEKINFYLDTISIKNLQILKE